MDKQVCRWGVLSTANITKKNWHSIVNSGNGRLVAIASRSTKKAKTFIEGCQASIPVAHPVDAVEGYETLLRRTDVDAVYLPLPTGVRTEWAIRAANAGKHVLIEKPCGVSADEVERIVAACNANAVQFMDGTMYLHSKRMAALRGVLDDRTTIGAVRRVATQFSFRAPESWIDENIRLSSALEPAGCLGDLGWYTIGITLWVMNYQLPSEVRGRVLRGIRRDDSEHTVPLEFQGEMHFDGGVSATWYNSFVTQHQQWLHVSGSAGYLEVKDFALPYFGNEVSFDVSKHDFVNDGCSFRMERSTRTHTISEHSNNHESAQETRLFRAFGDLVLHGKRDPRWAEVSLNTQRVLDAAFRSANENGRPTSPSS